MKKSLLASFVVVLALFMASCGSKSMTDEEIQAKAEEQFEEQKDAIAEEMEELCNDEFDDKVNAAVDSILAATEEM